MQDTKINPPVLICSVPSGRISVAFSLNNSLPPINAGKISSLNDLSTSCFYVEIGATFLNKDDCQAINNLKVLSAFIKVDEHNVFLRSFWPINLRTPFETVAEAAMPSCEDILKSPIR
jgi:hypothetical protein